MKNQAPALITARGGDRLINAFVLPTVYDMVRPWRDEGSYVLCRENSNFSYIFFPSGAFIIARTTTAIATMTAATMKGAEYVPVESLSHPPT